MIDSSDLKISHPKLLLIYFLMLEMYIQSQTCIEILIQYNSPKLIWECQISMLSKVALGKQNQRKIPEELYTKRYLSPGSHIIRYDATLAMSQTTKRTEQILFHEQKILH